MAKLISADISNNKLCILEYTTTDGKILSVKEDAFDAEIVSHSYTDVGKIIFQKPITVIKEKAFFGCSSLTSVTIPDSVTTIGEGAFAGCGSLQEFKGKFASKDGRCLIIDGTLNAFAPTGLTEYTIPNCVTTIGDYAFSDCSSLTSVTIPDSVTTIGVSAFYNCSSLISVTIPDSVTTIGEEAFWFCESLTSVYINDIAAWCNISFSSAESNPLYHTVNLYLNNELVTDLTIPDSVTTIGKSAFWGCDSLVSVTIPDSVITIGDSAFAVCDSLASVTIPDSVTTIGSGAFAWCTNLTSVTIPDSVTTIEEWAFGKCTSLKEFKGKFAADGGRCLIKDNTIIAYAEASGTTYTIPDSVTTIGEKAFSGCESLTSVTIGNGVTTIRSSAFFCTNLKEFKGKFAADGGRCLIIDGVLNAFALGCGATQYTIPDSVTTIGEEAFSGCESLTSVTIPDSVTTIGGHAFSWCISLTSVTIPNSVTTIGYSAFWECSSLTSVTIPDSVTTIGNWAFWGCSSLTSVTIGKSVSEIGEEAFEFCNIDTIVCYPKIPPKIDYSFRNFEKLIIPTGCEEAYANSDWGQYLE